MTAIPVVVLTARLDEARLAYHSLLMSGGTKRIRDSNGEEIEYTAASASRLAAYILSLEYALGEACPSPLNVWVI